MKSYFVTSQRHDSSIVESYSRAYEVYLNNSDDEIIGSVSAPQENETSGLVWCRTAGRFIRNTFGQG